MFVKQIGITNKQINKMQDVPDFNSFTLLTPM